MFPSRVLVQMCVFKVMMHCQDGLMDVCVCVHMGSMIRSMYGGQIKCTDWSLVHTTKLFHSSVTGRN